MMSNSAAARMLASPLVSSLSCPPDLHLANPSDDLSCSVRNFMHPELESLSSTDWGGSAPDRRSAFAAGDTPSTRTRSQGNPKRLAVRFLGAACGAYAVLADLRNCPGVTPTMRLKWWENWLWSEKPADAATSARGRSPPCS